MSSTIALRMQSLCKRFGGTQAVDAVSLDVHAGEILALLGENGAGKSTLIKLLAGVYPADSGSITLLGEAENAWRARAREYRGMAFIHQDLGLVEWMTVAENIALGMGFARRWIVPAAVPRTIRSGLQSLMPIHWGQVHANAERVLARVQCAMDPQRRVFSLTRTEKALLAIGRALDTQARVLVLDEPTASLPLSDVQQLFTLLRRLRRQGVAMIYVSHRLDEILELSDRAAVMRDGRLVGVRETRRSSASELAALIVGRAIAPAATKSAAPARHDKAPLLQLHDVYCANAGPVSLQAHAAEIVGLVGLRGAGHEHISRALFGLLPLAGGSMQLQQKRIAPQSPAQAIAHGIGLVAADRLEENLAATLSVQENLFPNPALFSRTALARLDKRRERRQARELVRQFDINPPAIQAEIQNLSGGNQQKAVLARWLHMRLPLLLLEEPTAGVDVGARQQIYAILRQQAWAGTCIVVISTDFEEISQLCDRALIFRSGQIAAQLHAPHMDMASLLLAASGGAAPAQENEESTP